MGTTDVPQPHHHRFSLHQRPTASDTRQVESGIPLPQYGDNAVVSSKYTWLNLIPKALWNQFRRLSNFYFLIVAAISFIPNISPSSPVTTTLPLVVVIGFGLARDVYEDFLRKKADARSNNRPVMIRRRRRSSNANSPRIPSSPVPPESDGSADDDDDAYARVLQEGILSPEDYVVVRSRDVRVGDIVLITDDLQIPADLVVIQSAMASGECFVSTANLDGESNLKRRLVPSVMKKAASAPIRSSSKSLATPSELDDHTYLDGAKKVTKEQPGDDVDEEEDTSTEKFDDTHHTVLDSIENEHIYSPVIIMSPPTPSLYEVQGTFCRRGDDNLSQSSILPLKEMDKKKLSESVPLDERNLLLRGSVLRNTGFVHGLAVYTGAETKLALNMRDAPSKLGGVEKMMNRVVIALFVALLVLTAVTSVLAGVWQAQDGHDQWYMGKDRLQSGATVALRSLGTFIILYHTFVPVSLFVTLEFVRLVQGIFISADQYMKTNGKGPDVRANNLNETLGYVDHVFSDKTGTLTQNVMRFAACAVPVPDIVDVDSQVASGSDRGNATATYDVREDEYAFLNAVRQSETDFELLPARKLAEAMALTHDVVPAAVAGHSKIEYQGESADEVALVDGAAKAGVELKQRQSRSVVISSTFSTSSASSHVSENEQRREILAVLDFSSDRKRMSIVMRCPDGRVRVFCKGADSVLCPLLRSKRAARSAQTASDELSRLGLRTLVYCSRVLSDDESSSWLRTFRAAANSMDDRARLLKRAAEAVEHSFDFIGVTGVEDRLQDDVPRTVDKLLDAGVRLWVLTGDKIETAENIGYSSNLLKHGMHVSIVTGDATGADFDAISGRVKEFATALDSTENDNTKSGPGFALIIDGKALSVIFGSETQHCRERPSADSQLDVDAVAAAGLRTAFVNVALRCKAVICARVTPLQKAEVVRLVRLHRKRLKQKRHKGNERRPGTLMEGEVSKTTLAIGDGGNDVSMIQEAEVGVGIKGREGAQAARAADYAIGEFRHLWRLLAVHGRFSYVRTCGVINLSLYKNVMFSCTQFLFQFFCFASGTTMHNQWVVTSWNALVTLLPPFLFGIYERDLEIATVAGVPQAYSVHHTKRLFGFRSVAEFTLGYSIWHANVIFWAVLACFGSPARSVFQNGHDAGFFLTGLVTSVLAVCVVLSKFLLTSHVWAYPVLIGAAVSFALLWILIVLFPIIFHETPLEGMVSRLFDSPTFNLLWPVVFVTAFIPDFLVRLRRNTRQDLVERLQTFEARKNL